MTALAALAGALVAGGSWLAVTSWRPQAIPARRPKRGAGLDRQSRQRLVACVAAGLVALVVTRWPVAAIAAGVAGWLLAGPNAGAARRREAEQTEAIALWAEMLRDAMGTGRGVEGVLVATAGVAPLPIRPAVEALAGRLQPARNGDRRVTLDEALGQLAVDLAHPLGDLVVTALRISAAEGATRVRDVLADLATAAYTSAESTRRIDVARARPRAAMRYTAGLIGGFVLLLLVFSRDYLEPYGSPVGQLVLALVAAYWAVGLWWMHRMGRSDPTPRWLAAGNGNGQ